MTKISVFIDFEAISMPFSREAQIADEFPYAYTLGIYVGNKFKTKTFVFNFQQDSVNDIYDVLRNYISRDIKGILGNKNQSINKSSVKFIGWSPILEKKILNKVFPGFDVSPLNKGFELSLSRLTPEIKDNYFVMTKKLIARHMDAEFIKRRNLDHDGAVAALAGYLLYSAVMPEKGKFYFDYDMKTLVGEIKKYSKEDVTRMAFLNDNRALFDKRKEKALKTLADKQVIIKSLDRAERLSHSLATMDQEKTIEVALKELKAEITKLKEEKSKLEKDFENI